MCSLKVANYVLSSAANGSGFNASSRSVARYFSRSSFYERTDF